MEYQTSQSTCSWNDCWEMSRACCIFCTDVTSSDGTAAVASHDTVPTIIITKTSNFIQNPKKHKCYKNGTCTHNIFNQSQRNLESSCVRQNIYFLFRVYFYCCVEVFTFIVSKCVCDMETIKLTYLLISTSNETKHNNIYVTQVKLRLCQ